MAQISSTGQYVGFLPYGLASAQKNPMRTPPTVPAPYWPVRYIGFALVPYAPWKMFLQG